MMNEHQVILRILSSLNELVSRLQNGNTVPREHIEKFVFFLQKFADKLHHGKEEERLFKKMVGCGFPREYGPIGIMLAEHNSSRENVKIMSEISVGRGELTSEEINKFIFSATEYIQLLFSHIQKEDNVLYPMALQSLSDEAFDELDEECFEYEKTSFTPNEVKDMYSIADELMAMYPANIKSLCFTLSPLIGCSNNSCGH